MPIENTTCFAEHMKRDLCCRNDSCRMHYSFAEDLNCVLIGVKLNQATYDQTLDELPDSPGGGKYRHNSGYMTLEQIGRRFDRGRASIYQRLKKIMKKLDELYELQDLHDIMNKVD